MLFIVYWGSIIVSRYLQQKQLSIAKIQTQKTLIDSKLLQVQELLATLDIQRQKIEEMIEVSDERSNSMIINMNHMLYCLLLYY
jgi:hypothetical protein